MEGELEKQPTYEEDLANLRCEQCDTAIYLPEEIPRVAESRIGHLRNLCDPCLEKEDEARKNAERQKRNEKLRQQATARWKMVIPQLYQNTDTAHDRFNQALFEHVMKWEPLPDQPWLGMVGPTGRCKTRCAVERLKVFAVEQLTSWDFIAATDLASTVRSQYGEQGASNKERIDRLYNVHALVIDDLDKINPTKSVLEALFGILERRMSHCLPTIWTANQPPDKFCRDYLEQFRDPIRGRLAEASETARLDS